MKLQDLLDAYEQLDYAREQLSETEGQARNEVAQFGDSWPGSAQDINRLYQEVIYWEKRVEWLRNEPLEA